MMTSNRWVPARQHVFMFVMFLVLFSVLAGCSTPRPELATGAPKTAASDADVSGKSPAGELILATTTSTENSGLLNFILPDFESKTGLKVSVIAVGTGQSLKLGEDGNADVVLVHARNLEDQFIEAGFGVNRQDVMYNDFVIVGPNSDPAGIRGSSDIVDALAKIWEAEATFVSRGDESGTHNKELQLWKEAGLDPLGSWYLSAGQGMGPVLIMSGEQKAYTLTDRATYLSMKNSRLELEILFEGDARLFNPYGVIAVNPDRYSHINIQGATAFIDWITSVEAQELIQSYGMDEYGDSLFFPDSEPWRAAKGQ